MLAPQLGQNFVPTGTCVPHFGHGIVAGDIEAPQLGQNAAFAGTIDPHFGQAFVGCCCIPDIIWPDIP
jgi:hypothetical protein